MRCAVVGLRILLRVIGCEARFPVRTGLKSATVCDRCRTACKIEGAGTRDGGSSSLHWDSLAVYYFCDNLPFSLQHVNGYHRMPVSRKKAEISETQATHEVTLSLKTLSLIYGIGDPREENPSTMAELLSTELPH